MDHLVTTAPPRRRLTTFVIDAAKDDHIKVQDLMKLIDLIALTCMIVSTAAGCSTSNAGPEASAVASEGDTVASVSHEARAESTGDVEACMTCTALHCGSELRACLGADTCQGWLSCIKGCSSNPTRACGDDCDARYAEAKPLYSPLYERTCTYCKAECAPACDL